MKVEESTQIKKEVLNSFKQYLLNRAKNQSMSEEFTNGFNYAIWEIEKFAAQFGINEIIEGSVPYKCNNFFKK